MHAGTCTYIHIEYRPRTSVPKAVRHVVNGHGGHLPGGHRPVVIRGCG